MNIVIIYSYIIKICDENNYKLLKFFFLDDLRKKLKKRKFLIIIFMSQKIKNKNNFYYALNLFIKKNYKFIINYYLN